jgi:glycosyltransferase involved in cell wall biosynthesis
MARLLIASGIFHPEAGGPATYLHQILPHLQQRGWEVRVITYGDAPITDYPYPLTRIPRRSLPLRLRDYGQAAHPLLQWADLVYIHTLGLPLIGGTVPRVLKIVGDQAWERAIRRGWVPESTDIDDFQTRAFNPIVRVQQMARAMEVRGVQQVIVPSDYLKRMVVGWGVDPVRVQVIYNALPPEPESQVTTQAEARALLELPPDAKLLLTGGRLHPWKGVGHVIAALAHVPDVRLIVAGAGPMRAVWEQQAVDFNLGDRVIFLGQIPREQMYRYMRAADYFVLYSGYEGLAHSALESLRAGTPVIASDKGGNPEVIALNVNGILVPYIDVDALTAAIKMAFQPGQQAALAANAQQGMERFEFTRMIDQTDAALRSFLR